jgi:exodeoxyribonuclease VII small subunit
MAKNDPADLNKVSFETAVSELEVIVNQMENNQLPLQEALSAFKRGTNLLLECQKTLAEVEQQIQLLNEDNQLQSYQDNQE